MGAAADASSRGADDSIDHVRLADYARAAQEQGKALGWRRLVQRQLLEVIDLRRSNLTQFSADEVKAEVRSAVERIVAGMQNLPPDIDRDMLVQDSVDEAVGLGPLERLMTDPLISEIMVNSATDIFVERKGKLQQVPLAFSDDDAIRNVIERIVAPLGRRIDESSPLVDARLPDGSRVNAIIPPVALKGPTITIRRFNRTVMTPDTLVANQSASPAMMEFLRICVEQHKSIIVSGGTGSGKTTLLNVLSNLIPVGERLITIEDAAELKLMHPHLVSLESRPPNAEGRGAITITVLSMAAVHTLGGQVDFWTALVLSVVASLGACGASGVAGGSLLLIPMACSLFAIDNDTAMQVVGVGFIIGVIQDSAETALNSSTDVLFTAAVDDAHKSPQ